MGPAILPSDPSLANSDQTQGLPQQRGHSRFSCHLCNRTYERQDHLGRHLRSHDNQRAHRCSECGKGFNRADLLTRHRAAHGTNTGGVQVPNNFRQRTGRACESCIRGKTKCDEGRPCERCSRRNEPCVPPESRNGRPWDGLRIPSSPMSMFPDNDTTLVSFGVNDGSLIQGAGNHHAVNPGGTDGAIPGNDPFFPGFFEQVMMSSAFENTSIEPLVQPPNVFNFTQDLDFGPLDFDFSFLAGGLTRPSTAQGFHGELEQIPQNSLPESDAGRRSEAFKRSPWSWNFWIPEKNQSTFSDQNEINVYQGRVSAGDQLTPGSDREIHCALETEARDRMIRVITQTADSNFAMPSFPSLDLLEDLTDVFLVQDSNAVDGFIHAPSFDSRQTLTELLIALASAGTTFVALPPVWKAGLVLQEVVRVAIGKVFETDNSTTRELQPLQAYLLWLHVGVWSGFRRKTEIASSFLQPALTMLMWSNAFASFRYKTIAPAADDDDETLSMKWQAWVEQEAFKRLVMHTYIHDSQVAIAHMSNALISPAQMQLSLPASRRQWLAATPHAWRNTFLSHDQQRLSALPSVATITVNFRMLESLGDITDQPLCILLACHSLAHDVFQFRQQALLFGMAQDQLRRERWLAHLHRQKDIYDDLISMHAYCDLQDTLLAEALFTMEYLMMSLHVSLHDIELFSGKSGEEEARRVFPQVRTWTQDAESRIAIWHAGQVLRTAWTFPKSKLRDFYAVTLYHATLTLWVYGMVTANTASKSGVTTPVQARSSNAGSTNALTASDVVLVDGADSKTAKAFRHFGHGKPGLRQRPSDPESSDLDHCFLQDYDSVMLVGARILKSNFSQSQASLPPLVENLTNLITDLSKFSRKQLS